MKTYRKRESAGQWSLACLRARVRHPGSLQCSIKLLCNPYSSTDAKREMSRLRSFRPWRVSTTGRHVDLRVGWPSSPDGEISGFTHLLVVCVLETAGLLPIDTYIKRRQNTLADNIATRPVLNLCEESERLSGSANRRFWWHQLREVV